MTNHWIDIKNADCVFIIGSNAAENHPICMKYVLEAQDKGAKVIHVDPRYSRTSSKADKYIRIRSGTDIAFMGGMIYYILTDMRKHPEKYNLEYVQQYSNAAYIVNKDVKLPGDPDQNGLFSDWDKDKGKYTADVLTWKYADPTSAKADSKLLSANWETWTNKGAEDDATAWGELGTADGDPVLKLLWRHYSRYTPKKVSQITGIPENKLLEVYADYASTGASDRVGTILYAMGATQHTFGTQNIRAYSIVQTLLGNMGVAGGGINALRGTSNVQGSTDQGLLWHILTGYLKVPLDSDAGLGEAPSTANPNGIGYLGRTTPKAITPPAELTAKDPVNWWKNTPKYVVSLLKTWWPNDDHKVSFDYLPKAVNGSNYSHISLIEAIGNSKVEGLWVWGQNPAAGGPNSNGAREALGKLKWMVVSDIWMNETAEFWKRPGLTQEEIQAIDTEVFVLPAAGSFEKQGTVSNSGRWVQWRYKAVEPPEMAKSDLDIMSILFKKIQGLYKEQGGVCPEPVVNLDWEYGDEVDPDIVAREMNGYALVDFTTGTRTYKAGELIDWFNDLQADGKTSSGNWLHCGQYNTASAADQANYPDLITVLPNGIPSINKTKRRNNVDNSLTGSTGDRIGLYANWSWCWPRNRRIIYNRAAVNLNGDPWDPKRPVLRWTGTAWETGSDIEDGGGKAINAAGSEKRLPFIMDPEGVAKLWGYGDRGTPLKDGPLPEVYEPWESPVVDGSGTPKNLMSGTVNDPAAFVGTYMNPRGTANEFPYVGVTYRCTEHWQTGIMTRNLPWLAELMPEMYVELGADLAEELGIASGDTVKVSSARGDIQALAVVTKRLHRLEVDGKTVHQIGIPFHWGYAGRVTGDSGNILTPHVGDANTTIPEYKGFLCKIEKV
jgi:formate dehydrogenase major subunit